MEELVEEGREDHFIPLAGIDVDLPVGGSFAEPPALFPLPNDIVLARDNGPPMALDLDPFW